MQMCRYAVAQNRCPNRLYHGRLNISGVYSSELCFQSRQTASDFTTGFLI